MDEQRARKILGDIIQPDDSLYSLSMYICGPEYNKCVTLDGEFSADQLQAIAWWMKNKEVFS